MRGIRVERAGAASPFTRRVSRCARGVVLLGAWLAACRDGPRLFTPQELEPLGGDAYQLTFGMGHDRDPRWAPGGDTLLYHTDSFGQLPRARGALVTIPRAGGVATAVFNDIQAPAEALLATPAYAPDGSRIAYIDLVRYTPAVACAPFRELPGGPPPPTEQCETLQPLLDSAVLRVRRVGETSLFTDPVLGFQFAGIDHRLRLGLPGPYVQQLHPFQAEHRQEHAMLFRPSWAPDGQRLVFSDGIALRIWRVGDAAAPAVPGTVDAVSPAWSPDGSRIAFTVLQRGDSVINTCACTELHQRTRYTIAARRLHLVRPDGGDPRVLGDGEDPAWSADGRFIFARRDDAIVRITVADGSAAVVPHTAGGRMPAPSPDGRWLAFARRKPSGTRDYDLWIVALAP